MRPGRLDRILYVGAPDLPARREIFRIKLATMALEPGIDLEALALVVSYHTPLIVRESKADGELPD